MSTPIIHNPIAFLILTTLAVLSFTPSAHAGLTTKENFIVPNGLVGYGNFEEGAGDKVYDKSGKGNNGVRTNMAQNIMGLGSALGFGCYN